LRNLLGIVTNDLADTCRRDLSGRELVLSGFFSSIGIWPNHEVTAEMEEKTTRTLERLEIAHLGGRSVDEMSSGEARRVLVARALVHEPSALVLDEPTNSLDFRALHEVREMMRRVAAEGTTVILVTHHLPDIIPEIKRVILLNEGRVIRDGSKEELLTPSVLSDVFGVPVDLARRDGYFVLY
jgi:iron complex transport system ATP-binding protein